MKIRSIILLLFVLFVGFSSYAQDSSSTEFKEFEGVLYQFTYYEKDQIKAIQKVKKEADGSYTFLDFYQLFDTKGNLYFRGNKLNGRQMEYYPTGNKKSIGFILEGKKDSVWFYFDENGDLNRSEEYKEGQMIESSKL